jgi:glycerol uptake facilitator-like aquaporin
MAVWLGEWDTPLLTGMAVTWQRNWRDGERLDFVRAALLHTGRDVLKIERPASKSAVNRLDPRSVPGRREADAPHSQSVTFGLDRPLLMDAGVALAPLTIAYQTYGRLNPARSNAVLICHALTGDQHVANVHPVTGKSGWWETMVGACMGTTGPA